MSFHILIIFWGHSMKQFKKNEEANAMIQEAVWNWNGWVEAGQMHEKTGPKKQLRIGRKQTI